MSFVTPAIKESLKNHVLEEALPQTGAFRAFYMKEPGKGRMMSTLFIFTPEGIVIMGDLCPGGPRNGGSISNYGYGIEWFGSQKSEYYLCEKFLVKEWQVELAEAWCREHVEEMKKTPEDHPDSLAQIEQWEELLAELQGGEMGRDHFHEVLQDLEYDIEDEGYGYPLRDAGWLCGLQQRFVELYAALPAEQPAQAGGSKA